MQTQLPVRKASRSGLFVALFLLAAAAGFPIGAFSQDTAVSLTLPAATAGSGYEVRLSLDRMVLTNPATITTDNSRPAWLNFDSASGTLRANPIPPPAQTYSLGIVITDGNAKTTNITAQLAVKVVAAAGAAGTEIGLPDKFHRQPYESAVVFLPTRPMHRPRRHADFSHGKSLSLL